MNTNTPGSISNLSDLSLLRTAPVLSKELQQKLIEELHREIATAEWFTVGIMASTEEKALLAIKQIESFFSWSPMRIIERAKEKGPVFLKANQSSQEIRIRTEHGLGEGILISGQIADKEKFSNTWGPFPLDFFIDKV